MNNKNKLLGYALNRDLDSLACSKIEDLSLHITPLTLRKLGCFFNDTADLIDKYGADTTGQWHQHFRDYFDDWDEDMIDIIISVAI